jgi:hypothetical protein
VPSGATNKTIAWTVTDAGGTGVGALGSGKATPSGAGTLKVRATVANGLGAGQNYTQDFTITIGAAFVKVTHIQFSPVLPTPLHATRELDLTGAKGMSQTGIGGSFVNATNQTVVWSLVDAGGTGVTGADLVGGKVTPKAAGTLKLLGTVTNGKTPTEDFTAEINFSIIFNKVTSIQGVPSMKVPGETIDLGDAAKNPPNASSLSPIVWSLADGGTTGVTTVDPEGGMVTPSAAGKLKLKATVAHGKGWNDPFEQDLEISIEEEASVHLYTTDGSIETEVSASIETLDDALNYIKDNAAAGDKFVIVLRAGHEKTPWSSPTGLGKANIEITLRGAGTERKITKKAFVTGTLFALANNTTLILDNNITLDGTGITTNVNMISLAAAHLRMKTGSKVTGFTYNGSVISATNVAGNTITLEGGEISGNQANYGVNMANGEFKMSAGAIKNNTVSYGLYLNGANVTGEMSGGEISGATTAGVYLNANAAFTMNDGEISGTTGTEGYNNAGWGVYMSPNTSFAMSGGAIKNNSARGISCAGTNIINMTGGTIEGNGNDVIFGKGIYLGWTSKLSINGPVAIKDTVGMMVGTNLIGPIYLGSSFNPTNAITINLGGSSSNFTATWITDSAAKPILKGGTSDSPIAITEGQWTAWGEKFVMGTTYTVTSTSTKSATERSGETFALTRDGDTGFGVAQRTANP